MVTRKVWSQAAPMEPQIDGDDEGASVGLCARCEKKGVVVCGLIVRERLLRSTRDAFQNKVCAMVE